RQPRLHGRSPTPAPGDPHGSLMIMVIWLVGGGRTSPPTQPDRPLASLSNGSPTCDQPWSRVFLLRLAPRKTPAPSRRACGLLTEAPAPSRPEEGCRPPSVAHPPPQA